jgi:small subunit ribosomal protein S4e
MHLKRQKAPKNWPIHRKGTKYIARPRSDLRKGISLLIVLRDMLKIVQNRREAKRAIHLQHIWLNNRPARDEKETVLLFDVIKIIPVKKSYVLDLTEKGKIAVSEMNKNELDKKVGKIINKKILKGGKIQVNLSDGRNFISDIKCNTNDSALISLEKKKIEKCIPLKEGAEIIVFAGKHAGKRGDVKKIDRKRKMVEIKTKDKKINVLIKQVMAIK